MPSVRLSFCNNHELLSFKITSRLLQHVGSLQNIKKLYSHMKNFERIWTCLLEQVNNPMRGEGISTQLACKNKWVDAGRHGQGVVLQGGDTEMSGPNVGCDAETSWLLCRGWKGSGSRVCGNQSGC